MGTALFDHPVSYFQFSWRRSHTDSSTMKLCLLILSTLCVMCLAPNLHDLIRHEVHFLLQADHGLTEDARTTKCDALFDLVAHGDEAVTDKMCQTECQCQINHNCQNTHHPTRTTAAGNHHPTRPHFTRAPAN